MSNSKSPSQPHVLLYLSIWLLVQATLAPQVAHGATLTDACLKTCGPYESCFLYENVEFCAQQCAAGRCNDATELCVLQGVECTQAPCLPVAVCEPRSKDSSTSFDDNSSGNNNSTSGACTRSCPMLDSPVCASDGTSYANKCFFEEAQCRDPSISLTSKGLCPADRALNIQYNPSSMVSPSSPSTQANGGSIACDAIVCADVEDPVCSTSGTLKNVCYLKKEQCRSPGVELLSRGPCEPLALMPRCPANCTQEFVPVCASSGVIYANECLFRQAKCARAFATSFVAKDLSECELDVGDSTSTVQGHRTVFTSVFD